MRLVLAPNKAALYPEFLGAFPPSHFACGLERLSPLRRRLSQALGTGFIDMWGRLSRLKNEATEPIYFPGGSHWTPKSAAEMSRAIVESIEPGLWSDDDVREQRQIDGRGESIDSAAHAARAGLVRTMAIDTLAPYFAHITCLVR